MPNEVIWLLQVLVNFAAIFLVYRFFGKAGLYFWIPIATILANIQVLKLVELFGVTTTLGNIIYGTSFLATDILSENYGKKEAKNAVAIGFFALIFTTIVMNVAIAFQPSELDTGHGSIEAIFSLLPVLGLASLAAYGVSQAHDVWAYHFWRRLRPSPKFIWLRNNLSTLVSQTIDTAVFQLIATLGGIFPWEAFWEIALSVLLIKLLIALLDTPVIYAAAHLHSKGKVREI